jgi:putative acetyltransferase
MRAQAGSDAGGFEPFRVKEILPNPPTWQKPKPQVKGPQRWARGERVGGYARRVILRSEEPADAQAIDRVNRRAFGGSEEALLVARLRASSAFIPGLSIVAEEDGGIIGHILFTRVQLDPPTEAQVISLAPMAVLPAFQRRGVGSALVRRGLDVATQLGEDLVVVVGHPGYYPRFGFERASRLGITSPFPAPDAAFLALRLRSGGPTPSGEVVYPPEFEARDA